MALVEAARAADCAALAATSKRAFDHDVHFGAPGPGGPPGYDSPAWHRRAFDWGRVFRLLHGDTVVGGAIVIVHSAEHVELGRIWLDPAAQGRGLGTAAMGALAALFPDAERWTLETPLWNLRTRRFYATLGFREVRRTAAEIHYEKARSDRPNDSSGSGSAIGHSASADDVRKQAAS